MGGLIAGNLGFKTSILVTLFMLFFSVVLVCLLVVAPILKRNSTTRSANKKDDKNSLNLDVTDLKLALPVIAANLVEGFIFSIVVSMVPSLAYRRGLTYEEIGLSYSMMGLSRLAVLLSFSKIYKLMPYRAWITLSSLLAFLSMLLIAGSRGVLMFSLALTLVGIAIGVFYPSTATMILSFRSSTLLMGLYEAFLGIGFATSPVLVGVLTDVLGDTISYTVVAVISLFMLVGVLSKQAE
jgi:MFS family permease